MAQSSSIMWTRFIPLCLGCLAMMVPILSVKADERILTPERLLAVFYENLLSDKLPEEKPQIFAEPTTIASMLPGSKGDVTTNMHVATSAVWKYFQDNKHVFLFPTYEPAQTMKKAHVGYYFTAFPSTATFFDGIFYIVLSAPLSKGGREGVAKEIYFPLERNDGPTGPRYLINVNSILVNGALLDPLKEFDRSGNLYQQLGIAPGAKP